MTYKPKARFSTPMYLFQPSTALVNGVRTKTYPDTGTLFYGSFKTYGGTETTSNGLLVVEDTADVETYYNPDIKSDCIVELAATGKRYEIISEPENISMENQYMKFKVRIKKGGA